MGLGGREGLLFAVDGASCRGEDHLANPAAPGRLQEVEEATDIDVGVEPGVLHGTTDVHLGGVVDEDLHSPAGDEFSRLRRADVRHHELCARWDVFLAAGGQIVQNNHVVPLVEQRLGHV